MSTPRSKRLKGPQGKDFDVVFEYGKDNGVVVLHFERIDKFTKDTFLEMKFMLEDWSDFFSSLGTESLYAGIDPDNIKMRRLVKKLGFRYLTDNEGVSLYEYRSN